MRLGGSRAAGSAILAALLVLACPSARASGSRLLLLLPPPAAPAAPSAPSTASLEVPAPPSPSPAPEPAPAAPDAAAETPAEPPEAAAPHASGFPFVYPGAWLAAAAFETLPGWAEDRHEASLKAFRASCRSILRAARPPRAAPPVWRALRDICPRALALPAGASRAEARAFFEAEFRPVRIAAFGERVDQDGFLTGYYEPEIFASRERTEAFPAPFLAKPDDLVPGNRATAGGFDARGGAGRWVNGRFLPYFDRQEIESGALDGRGLEIAWVRDPVDVLFAQIQGSARLRFADGSSLRIGYAAHNGHRYVPVGRVMVERGVATREQMSMDFIRAWMAANAEAARDIRWQNRSYVFFRVKTELAPEDGPIGAQGIPIADWRSIAVDRNVHVYGMPIYIDAVLPTGQGESGEPFRRLMIAQDTGSAIVGPARGDLFLGTGPEAGSVAGRIRHRADWYLLMPRALSPEAAAVPLPLPREARR